MSEYQGQVAITIEAPIAGVYAYLLDFTKHPEWAMNLSKVTPMTPGPVAVGTRFQTQEGPPPVTPGQKAKMMLYFVLGLLKGAKPYSEATITALEPPCRIAWQAGVPKGDGFFNFAEWEFVLAPQGTATRVTQHFNYQPQNPTAERMVKAAGAKGLETAVAASLAQLKRRLETPSSQGR
jgi:uncharacterized membrane protein